MISFDTIANSKLIVDINFFSEKLATLHKICESTRFHWPAFCRNNSFKIRGRILGIFLLLTKVLSVAQYNLANMERLFDIFESSEWYFSVEVFYTIQDELFQSSLRMEWAKSLPTTYLKFVAQILKWWNLAQLYLT